MHKINFIPPLVFEILKFQKPFWACLGLPDPIHLKLHHQFVALTDMYLHAKKKINFILPTVFEILNFKNLAIWLAKSIFAFNLINSRTRFSQTCGCNRILKVIMVHDLNPKNLHINDHFLQNPKIPILGVLFSPKIWFRLFFTLKAP